MLDSIGRGTMDFLSADLSDFYADAVVGGDFKREGRIRLAGEGEIVKGLLRDADGDGL